MSSECRNGTGVQVGDRDSRENKKIMPTFDVIIPAYNAARFLPAALDSVIAQTFTDWRILLVDDGSQDNTPELVAPYQERLGDKLKYIRQPNAGLPAARNTAIRNSTAEFLALLDADDVWLPQRLEKTIQVFRDGPEVGLVHGLNARIDANGDVIDTCLERGRHAEGWVAPYIYMRMLDLNCPTVSFRRVCVDEVGLFDETFRATEDRDLWLRIALRYKVGLVREVIAHYRMSAQSMSTDLDRMLRSQLKLVDKHYGQPGCGWIPRRVALSWAYRQRADAFAARGQMKAAVANALRAFTLYPFSMRNLRALLSLSLRGIGMIPRKQPIAA